LVQLSSVSRASLPRGASARMAATTFTLYDRTATDRDYLVEGLFHVVASPVLYSDSFHTANHGPGRVKQGQASHVCLLMPSGTPLVLRILNAASRTIGQGEKTGGRVAREAAAWSPQLTNRLTMVYYYLSELVFDCA
jgi:hypothetical protein